MNINNVKQQDIDLVQKFLDTKPDDVVVYKGTIRSDILLDRMFGKDGPYGKIEQLSSMIESYAEVGYDVREEFKDADASHVIDPATDCPLTRLYKISKIRYLLDSIGEVGVFAPFVALNADNVRYRIHPGSDRMAVMDLLKWQDIILDVPVYWAWYKSLYPTATLHHDMKDCVEITTAEQFFDQFIEKDYQANAFFDLTMTITSDTFNAVSNSEEYDDFVPSRTFTYKNFSDWGKTDLLSHTHVDWLCWIPNLDMVEMRLDRNYVADVYFKDESTFCLGDITFVKTNAPYDRQKILWIPQFILEKMQKSS